MGNTPKVQGDRRARAAAARQAAQARERRRRMLLTAGGAVVVLVVVGVLLFVGLSGKKSSSSPPAKITTSGTPAPAPLATGQPPWPAPTGAAGLAAIHAAGLQAYGQEMLSYHIHSHLDVIDQGQAVPVPAGIGFAYNSAGQATGLSALHTHQPDGIIHIEAPKQTTYTLGQVFKEWGVRLSPTCVGGLCADGGHTLSFYVNGKQVTGDPASIQLAQHEEIAVIYAKKGEKVTPPASYTFPSGD